MTPLENFIVPKTDSRPRTPPLIFPASYAILPTSIADRIKIIDTILISLLSNCETIALDKDF